LQKKEVANNYDKEGSSYDNIRYGRTLGGQFFSEIELTNTLGMLKRGTVLHIGTATGRVSEYLVVKGFDYVGLEISSVMAGITKAKLNARGSVVRGDGEHLPFRSASFDNVVSVRSFHFLPSPKQFLGDANEVLKPAGRLVVSFERRVYGRETLRKMMKLPDSAVKRTYYTNSEVALMVRSAGFKIRFTGNVTKLPLLAYWRAKNDRILRKAHGKMPSFLGTVGMVVGSKY